VFIFPGDEKNQSDAGANRAVGNIERGKADFISAALLQIEINEIHDSMAAGQKPVGQISGDASEDQSERNLSGERVRIKMMPCQKKCDKREQRDERKRAVVAAKKTPCRTGVAPVDEFEEAVDDDFFIARFEQVQHEPFGKLVECEDEQRQRGDAAVRFCKNGLDGSHGKFVDTSLIKFVAKTIRFLNSDLHFIWRGKWLL